MSLNSKFLIKSLIWGVALLAMNQSYADNHLQLNVSNKKETTNLEKNLDKKPNLKVQSIPIETKEKKLNLDLDLSILDKSKGVMVQKNTVATPKTHYGVGYEYRRSMKMQRQNLEHTEFPLRVEHPSLMQRPERANRPNRLGRPNRR